MKIETIPSMAGDVMPPMVANLIARIKNAGDTDKFVQELDRARSFQTVLAKTELYRWAEVLNRCDELLEEASTSVDFSMAVDTSEEIKFRTIAILRFTSLLFECSSTRRVYSSTERLITLLDCTDLDVVAEVLRLLQTISKRSKYLNQRLSPLDRNKLVQVLTAIAQSWGGKLRSIKMTDCISKEVKVPSLFPLACADNKELFCCTNNTTKLHEDSPLLGIVNDLCDGMSSDHKYFALARLRVLKNFHNPDHRMKCLIVRLLSISTLIHCRCQSDESQFSAILYTGFIEETVALLRINLEEHPLVDTIQAEALRTLISIVSLDKQPMLNQILECLGASSYHGFLAVFTRTIVEYLQTNQLGKPGKPSVALGTSLFSFIYHLSSADTGGENLVACGLTQTLLTVLEYKDLCLEHISFATRCARIIDIFTTIDVTMFNSCKGMNIFVERFVHEIDQCRKDQPFTIDVTGDVDDETEKTTFVKTPVVEKRCHQQRSGLIKGLLTFLKRAIQEPTLQDSVRHIMEGGLPDALMHIISNAEYYSESIYHHALQMVTFFIYQEPSQLGFLQSKHLPYVILQSILRKELPGSRDVISNLGNVFTALCLNEVGLRQFKSYRPFDHVFKIVLSIKFIATMKKKRSEMNDAAQGIGQALEDLLRHQPTLKPLMVESVFDVLDLLLKLGTTPPSNTKIVMALSKSASKAVGQSISSSVIVSNSASSQQDYENNITFSPRDEDMSDEDEDAELSMDEMSADRQPVIDNMGLEMDIPSENNDGTRILPLGDYLIIFSKILETIIGHSVSNDIMTSFVAKGGVNKLIMLTLLPSLSPDIVPTYFGHSIAVVIQQLLQYGESGQILMESFLNLFVARVPFAHPIQPSKAASLLLNESKQVVVDSMCFINNCIPLLSQICKTTLGGGQFSNDRRNKMHEAFLTDPGKNLLIKIRKVSRILAWESGLIKTLEPAKQVVSTQTDANDLAIDDKNEATPIPDSTDVGSVSCDTSDQLSPECEKFGITAEEVTYWRSNKSIGDTIVKANKNVSEFLNLLCRSCYIPTRRHRRYEYSLTPMPKFASQLADQLFSGAYREMKWEPVSSVVSPMSFVVLHESLLQLNGVLFDDRKYPYHAMIERFYSSGCHQAFCDMLIDKLAPALDNHKSPAFDEAILEWFRLAEKLACRQKMLQTNYRFHSNQGLPFDAEKYCKLVHNDFFRCLSVLFSYLSKDTVDLREYQALCESAISVYREVAQSLVPNEEPEVTTGANRTRLDEHAKALNDMGFDRDLVNEALLICSNPADATEWLIRHQQQANEGRPKPQQKEDEEEDFAAPIITPLRELNINKDVSVSQACIELMPLCKKLMEVGSDLVFSCADLVTGVIESLDGTWKENILIRQIMGEEIVSMTKAASPLFQEKEICVLSTRIHFVCLLFEHLAEDYVEALKTMNLVPNMLYLLNEVYINFDKPQMPNLLLPPLVLWLDLYEKCSRTLKRRKLLEKIVPSKQLKWSYITDEESRYSTLRSKRWVPFCANYQQILNKEFFRGRSQAILKKKDKEIVIDFTSMKQKESDNVKSKINMELPEGTEFTLEEVLEVESESIWTPSELSDLMVQLIRLLHKGNIHHTAVHSILSFTARLTRDEACGAHFLQSGGVGAMLQLRSSSSPFTVALVSIILRQCIDNDDICKGVYEKVVRQIISSHNSNVSSQYDTKYWHDTMRRMLPLAVRKPAVFVSTMNKCVKLTPINNGLGMQFISKSYKASTDTNSSMNHIVALLLKEIYQGEWENAEKQSLGRMLSRGTLLSLLAELAKTYNGIANTVAETRENGHSMLYLLLERYVDGHDKETMKSLRYLLCVIATGNHSPKAQESAISDLKSVLVNVSSNTSSTEDICTKVEELCNIVIDMSDTCPSSHQAAKNSHSYQIIKLFHKKKICNDLVKTITYLQLVQKESIDTINHVLRTLESLMKILNTHHNATTNNSSSRNLTRMDILRPGVIELVQHGEDDVDMMRDQVTIRSIEQQGIGFREALERLPAEDNDDGAANVSQMDDVDVEGDSEGSVLGEIVVDDDNARREEEEEEEEDDEDQEMRDVEDDEEDDDEDDDDDDDEEESDEDDDGPQDTEQNITMPIQPDLTAEEEETEEGEEEEEEDDDQDEFELDDEPSFEHNRDVEAIYDDLDRPVIMGIDDWNLFPPININRLREPRSRAVTGEQHHPLLVRPPPASDAAPSFNASNISGSMREFRSILSGHQLVLTRQNAIRRLGQASRNLQQALHPNAPILERIFSLPPSRERPALLSFMGFEDPRPRAMSVIRTALERLTEAVDLLEPNSSRYIGLLVFELAAKETRKKYDEERKTDSKDKSSAENKNDGVSTEAQEEVVVVAPPQSEEARPAWDENAESQDTASTQPSSSEPMEAISSNAQDGDSSQADDVPLPSSAATVASSLEGEGEGEVGEGDQDEDEDVDGDVEDGIQRFLMPLNIDGNAEYPVPDESSNLIEANPSGNEPVPQEPSNVPEELRDVLGDIVLPEGVDPHFLAALPEELRGEVIRDHERQRRAQRATEAPRPEEGERPLVDPIDQDFLAALPPELQEEILQQHERAVREAEDAVRRANAPPVEPEMDGAAVIASLPTSERVQVLADMDETELQRLPQAMQDEARRARSQIQSLFEPRNVMRIHNLYVGGPLNSRRQPIFRRNPAYPPAGIGNFAGKTTTARAEAVQLLDREAILTICGLFLVDNRLNVGRLQKVIRMVCSHVASCDFVIWCLQAILDKASDAITDDEEFTSVCPSWLESITVPGIGHNERSVKISKDAKKVSIHPLISDQVCRNVLDSLIQLAKLFPGNFLPASLRQQNPESKDLSKYDQFWAMIQNPQVKLLSIKEGSEFDALKNSRLSQLTSHFKKKSFQRVSGLQDKLLKLLSSVIQTLPNDTMKSLNLESTGTAFEEELGTIIEILTQGVCSAEGFSDGRALLTEAMRALSPTTSDFIYDKLVSAIDNVGMQLKPQISLLLTQLEDIDLDDSLETGTSQSEKGKVKSLRLQGESVVVDADTTGRLMVAASVCKELRLPSVMALTDKSGAQYRLLSSLQTLTKIRDAMRTLKEERRKKREEEIQLLKKKKLEEEKKKEKEEGQAEEEPTEKTGEGLSLPKEAQDETKELVDDPMEKLRSLECLDARLSQRLDGLEDLWSLVSDCLIRLGKASDPHAVLALQPAAEAFFLVHAAYKNANNEHNHENPDTEKMIEFAEKHRDVLNQVLRQNSTSLSSGGPFAILTSFPKLLDFDVKRKYFRKELTKADGDREYRRSDINVPVRRSQLFSDSFRELFRLRPADWKKRFYIVFQGEEGQDAGGLLREWFSVITREIFNPNYALFITAPGDMVTYMINKASYINPEHLDYFKFVGRLIAKAIYDNKLLDCYFTRAFYKHILNLPVRYQDIESEDPAFFNSLEFLLKNPINDLALDLTFSLEVEEFGVRSIRDLKPDGSQIEVNDENKVEYVNLVCQMKMTGSIRKQLDAFLTGFYEIIPKDLISMFNEQELELLISGLPDIDIDDLANNTEYRSYSKTCPQIQWFWRALRSFEPEDRAKFLQFVTGTSKVPLQGFGSLEGMSGVQKFSIHLDSRGGDRLPAAHTCFNQLDLPQYDSYEKLREFLLLAIRECTEGFGFA
ncbi:unnamed protein product [Auanema sp. JU1783]|nr:unnamed protein product [Auanema sp. JU1783]